MVRFFGPSVEGGVSRGLRSFLGTFSDHEQMVGAPRVEYQRYDFASPVVHCRPAWWSGPHPSRSVERWADGSPFLSPLHCHCQNHVPGIFLHYLFASRQFLERVSPP